MKKNDEIEKDLEKDSMYRFEKLGRDAQALRREIEEFRLAEEALHVSAKELIETRKDKEVELKRIKLKRYLVSNKFL